MKQLLPFSLLLGLAPLASAVAQDITNNGATIALTGGATLYTSGSFTNSSGTLDLSSGSNQLYVGGNLVNASSATLTPGTASTVTLNGTATQQLSLNGAQLANLTVNNTSTNGVTLPAGSDASVAGALTLTNGLVTVDASSTLRLLDGASLTGEQSSRYVRGPVAAVKANVPAGAATAFPNSFTITPTTAVSNLTVTRRAGMNTAQSSYGTSASGNQGIDRIWQTSTPVDGTVQLTWVSGNPSTVGNDNGFTDFSNSQVWARNAAPVANSDWMRVTNPGTVDGSSRSVTSPINPIYGTRSFSFFTVSTSASPLPVALVAFEAARTGDAALLTWRTASELNNDHFEVEMSVDGQVFRKIGQVAGQGTKVTATSYSLTDPRLLAYAADPVYYRLRQVDTDGTATYSPVRTVQVAGSLAFAIAAFPNPLGTDGTHLQVRTGSVGPLTLTGYDATGRLVFTRSADLQRGANALELPEAGQLATGVYYVKATQAGQSAVLKLTRE